MAKFLRKFVLNLLKSAAWVLYFYRSHKKLKQKSRFFRQHVCKNQNNVVVLQAKNRKQNVMDKAYTYFYGYYFYFAEICEAVSRK